jgi:hypothetical protein
MGVMKYTVFLCDWWLIFYQCVIFRVVEQFDDGCWEG